MIYPVLDAIADLFGRVERYLFVALYVRGGDLKELKSEYLKRFGITARMFNAIRVTLEGNGSCGGRSFGEELPPDLELRRILLTAGRSTQATLLGRNEITVESLYLSPALQERIARDGGVRETHIGREAHSAVESLGQQLFD